MKLAQEYMWCNQVKWVLCRALSNLRFVVYLIEQSESFVLLKTPSKSDLRFQRYTQFCPAENNKIQRDFHTIIGCISKSIFPTYDSFRLITTHILLWHFTMTSTRQTKNFTLKRFKLHIFARTKNEILWQYVVSLFHNSYLQTYGILRNTVLCPIPTIFLIKTFTYHFSPEGHRKSSAFPHIFAFATFHNKIIPKIQLEFGFPY